MIVCTCLSYFLNLPYPLLPSLRPVRRMNLEPVLQSELRKKKKANKIIKIIKYLGRACTKISTPTETERLLHLLKLKYLLTNPLQKRCFKVVLTSLCISYCQSLDGRKEP